MFKLFAPTGCIGYGFLDSSLEQGLAQNPDLIGADGGSSDPGPAYLGSGKPFVSRDSVFHDLDRILPEAKRRNIPVAIGTAGGSGGNPHVDWTLDIVREIARSRRINLRVAVIRSEFDKRRLIDALGKGKIRPLPGGPQIDQAVIERAERIVGLMGLEPFQEALRQNVDLILAGRACDASIFAAGPVAKGVPRGIALHAAKIIQCGNGAVEQRIIPDGMVAQLTNDDFVLTPLMAETRCTPQSIISHSLYENPDSHLTPEPGGVLDTSDAWYRQEPDGRSVRVGGSKFHPAPVSTIRLEGVEFAGYRTITLGTIRDVVLIEQIAPFCDRVMRKWHARIAEMHSNTLRRKDYVLNIRLLGINGAMGPRETRKHSGYEIGIVLEAVAPTQQQASALLGIGQTLIFHAPVEGWSGQVSNIAFPYSPSNIDTGPVYRFSMNHVIELDDPAAPFPIEIVRL